MVEMDIGGGCEEGEDGQDGQNGSSAFVYYSNIEDLKNVKLDMSGGQGGISGRNGSSYNCDSYNSYTRARDGNRGQFGSISLIHKDTLLLKKKTSNNIDLLTSHGTKLSFFSHSWEKMIGAKELFHNQSNIRNDYSIFKETISTNISIELSNEVQEMDLENIALEVKYDQKYTLTPKLTLLENNKKLNALIDYIYEDINETKIISVKNVFYKNDISDTRLIGSNNSGLKTSLSLQDPLFIDKLFSNSFSFSLYKYHPFIDHYVIVGSASSKYLDVVQDKDIITVNIGNASTFKNEFEPGSKYKVIIYTKKNIGKNSLSYKTISTFIIPSIIGAE